MKLVILDSYCAVSDDLSLEGLQALHKVLFMTAFIEPYYVIKSLETLDVTGICRALCFKVVYCLL